MPSFVPARGQANLDDGPGVLIIFDMPDLSAAAAISGIGVASGAVHNVKLTTVVHARRNSSRSPNGGQASQGIQTARKEVAVRPATDEIEDLDA